MHVLSLFIHIYARFMFMWKLRGFKYRCVFAWWPLQVILVAISYEITAHIKWEYPSNFDDNLHIDAYEQAEHVHKQNLQPLLLPQTASLEINNAVLKAYLQLDTQKISGL